MPFTIPIWLPVALFLIGVASLVFKVAIAKKINALVGTPLGVKADFVALIFIIGGFALGGFTTIWGSVAGFGSAAATITGGDATGDVTTDYTGQITVKLHDGLTNTSGTAVTSEDYLNDEKDFMTIYSADGNIIDGEEYQWNITIERSSVAYADTVLVTCSIADKEISGVTADSLVEKTSGEIDLDINDGGTHSDDNTVWKRISFSAGTSEANIQIAYDQEETYHDGMTDMDDYVDTICVVSDDDQSLTTTMRVKANS